jgi:hypothetical protein
LNTRGETALTDTLRFARKALAALVGVVMAVTASEAQVPPSPPSPVVVELFTSEGCSSCPPAEEFLAALSRGGAGVAIVALEQHVDYWDSLGWPDPFASELHTRRQNEYARAAHTTRIFTPQMIVDGRFSCVGSDAGQATAALRTAAASPKAQVVVRRTSNREAGARILHLQIEVQDIPQTGRVYPIGVQLAVTESGLVSQVRKGENAGRKLHHVAVVRTIISAGTVKPNARESQRIEADVPLDPSWDLRQLHVVAFLQERPGERILGAGKCQLAAQ